MPTTREEVTKNLLIREIGVQAIIKIVVEAYNEQIGLTHDCPDNNLKEELLQKMMPKIRETCIDFFDHELKKGIPFQVKWLLNEDKTAFKVRFIYPDDDELEEVKKQAKSVFED